MLVVLHITRSGVLSDTTVIIKTVGRPSLKAAIRSARREGFRVIVVSDGAKVSAQGARFVKLGRKWGYYGGMCANVGAALASTPFITFLDDDDVFIKGAGDIIRRNLKEKPDVDIWIGGVRFARDVVMRNTETGEETYRGTDFAIWPEKGIVEGNACMPTYRTKVFETIPFMNNIKEEFNRLTDYIHILTCSQKGFKVDWFKEVIYLVRPHKKEEEGYGAVNGRGNDT